MSITAAIREGQLSRTISNYPNRAKLRRYFNRLLNDYRVENSPCLFLPSFPELAANLECSALDLHCALRELRRQGYDYFSLGLHSPVTLWHPTKIG
jgi:hypothetical protein